MISDRYRIVGLLGRGGMGEVYRADDLTLGQSVALKFLPEALAADPERRALFLNEVRTAREISHPNVCRVYDVGEVDGQTFLSMEYVDGEDLSLLLRRIGRLPGEKAVEISRQLCAGIAALHDRGLLHRDLKPSNVMIDGRGRVRITDFGLAIPADSQDGVQRVGTPAYMAPEVLDGRGADVRSDIYALGLVLYEIYTGRRAFEADTMAEIVRMQREATPTNPSEIITDLDPAVERVLDRCLDKDPVRRPPSAIAVAAALPGGDPLQAALAAGEIPSLEMVANAGEKGGIAPALGVACLAAVVAALLVYVFVGSKDMLYRYDPLEKPPAVLADRAREMLEGFGYPDKPADTAHGFQRAGETLAWISRSDDSPDRWETLRDAEPAGYFFWYRESPTPLIARGVRGMITPSDPPDDVRGRRYVSLDTTGRLRTLTVVPPLKDAPDSAESESPPVAPDWSALFAASGLDMDTFREVEPEWVPEHYADTRIAWVGPYPDDPSVEMRVEAASHRGRPVGFRKVGPWIRETPETLDDASLGERLFVWTFLSVILLMIFGTVFLAVRNVRQGRGDQVGARRLSIVYFGVQLVIWVFTAHHPADFNAEINQFLTGIAGGLLGSFLFWTFYLALEPYARRTWPNLLVAWSRVVTGRVRDPLVGRDILVGGLFFLFNVGLDAAADSVVTAMGLPHGAPNGSDWFEFPGALPTVSYVLAGAFNSFFYALFILALIMALRSGSLFLARLLSPVPGLPVLLRSQWAAIVTFAVLFAALTYFSASDEAKLVGGIQGILLGTVWAIVLFRFGLVTFVIGTFFHSLVKEAPLTLDASVWYFGASVGTIAVILALTAFGLHSALSGRSWLDDSAPERP